MFASRAVLARINDLLSDDTVTFNQATNALEVHAMKAPFTESLDTAFVSGDEATFPGYAIVDVELGPQEIYYDPLTQEYVLELIPPAGGFHFERGAGAGAAQDIHGVIVTTNAAAVVLGSQLLENGPVTITNEGDGFTVPMLQVRIPVTALTPEGP